MSVTNTPARSEIQRRPEDQTQESAHVKLGLSQTLLSAGLRVIRDRNYRF